VCGARVSATARLIELRGKAGDLTGVGELTAQLATQCGDFRAAAESFRSTCETLGWSTSGWVRLRAVFVTPGVARLPRAQPDGSGSGLGLFSVP